MSTAERFSAIGKAVRKATVASFPDTMTFQVDEEVPDGAGGMKLDDSADKPHSNVPCAIIPKMKSFRDNTTGKVSSVTQYEIRYPVLDEDGTRIREDTRGKITVNARGLEPAKTFEIIGIKNYSGIWYEATCSLISGV